MGKRWSDWGLYVVVWRVSYARAYPGKSLYGPGKRGHNVADTLVPTQMFPRLPAGATSVADTNIVSGTQKMFLILFRNILCPQQMFPSLRSIETQHSFCVPRVCVPIKYHDQQWVRNNVSATICPCARAFRDLRNKGSDNENKKTMIWLVEWGEFIVLHVRHAL